MFKNTRQKLNERKFPYHAELLDGGRKYWYDVEGRYGYKARYVKEVDEYEETVSFYQEIYDEHGKLIERHEKYPINKGHRKMTEG